jgi:hypothetical protein
MTPIRARDLSVIIRSCDERTLDTCREALRGQINPGAVTEIREQPFSKAVLSTMRLGAASGSRFVVALDADVLLTRTALRDLLDLCESAPPESFKINGVVLCRFMDGFCFRGVHAYRGSLLPRALMHAELAFGADRASTAPTLRPETSIAECMEREGHGFHVQPRILGVHDFEQSLRHIYVKMLLRGRKTEERAWMRGSFTRRAQRDTPDAIDFQVALWGFDDGLHDEAAGVQSISRAATEYDWQRTDPRFDRRMLEHGLSEKPPLSNVEHADNLAQRFLDAYHPSDDESTPDWIRKALGLPRLRAAAAGTP